MRYSFLIYCFVAVATGAVLAEDLVNESVRGSADVAANTTNITTLAPTPKPTDVTTTSTTTAIPTTTTTAATTVVPTPTPTGTPIPAPPKPPSPTKGNWIIREPMTNVTCVMLSMAASVTVPYRTHNNDIWNTTVNIPTDAYATGVCGPNEQTIMLSWNANVSAMATPNNTLEFIFAKNVTNATSDDGIQFYVRNVTATLFPDPYYFPGAADMGTISARSGLSNLFATSLNNSYSCRADQGVTLLTDALVNNTAVLSLRQVQVEAFRTTDDQSFSRAAVCSADGMATSDIVPIAVGCALAALVVVVLIAYLIGRRRARQRGYQSV